MVHNSLNESSLRQQLQVKFLINRVCQGKNGGQILSILYLLELKELRNGLVPKWENFCSDDVVGTFEIGRWRFFKLFQKTWKDVIHQNLYGLLVLSGLLFRGKDSGKKLNDFIYNLFSQTIILKTVQEDDKHEWRELLVSCSWRRSHPVQLNEHWSWARCYHSCKSPHIYGLYYICVCVYQ